jgi:hypothetical protein
VSNAPSEFDLNAVVSGLKEEIQAHVLMAPPTTWVEATKKSKEAQQIVSSQNYKPSFIPHPKPVNPLLPSPH